MILGPKPKLFNNIKYDFPASIIVFLVAMPLCLGIALASGAPLFSGLIAGVIGGVVVGAFSGSALGVSGPAAGLTVIVLAALQDLGSFETFLLAVIFAGVFQLIMGFLKAGVIGYFFPTPVINGMLAGIGLIIILKQIPHSVGYDADYEGDMSFQQPDSENTFSELFRMMDFLSYGPMTIALVSLAILILWEMKFIKKYKIFQLIQGPLVAVVAGVILNIIFSGIEGFKLSPSQLVAIPTEGGITDLLNNLRFPNWSEIGNPKIYMTGIILAVVGSLETLLSVEAADKQDPWKRRTPTNQELKAQGIGNIICGLLGGLPVTQVIVRSSVNVQAGGRTKMSTMLHGVIILLALIFIPGLMNKIPLSTLAAILFLVGYKLAKPSIFKKTFKQGYEQFIPFIATILGIVFTDLLMGIFIGLITAIFFILHKNYKIPIIINDQIKQEGSFIIKLSEDVSFLKKASLQKVLHDIPNGRDVTIDASNTFYIHQDVIDVIEDFLITAKHRDIRVSLIQLYEHKSEEPIIHFEVQKK